MLNNACDEYTKRKNIDVRNCFHPRKNSCFFVNCNKSSNWYLVEIYWKVTSSHPNNFVINLKLSKSNSFKESFGQNFYLETYKNTYWDNVEKELKLLLIEKIDINYNRLISEKYQAKIISWIFFSNAIKSVNEKIDSDLKNIFKHKNLDNFLKFKEYEYEIDKMLLYLKNKHKVIYSYYEIYFEQEILDFYWYDSYKFLVDLFPENNLKAKVYTTWQQ